MQQSSTLGMEKKTLKFSGAFCLAAGLFCLAAGLAWLLFPIAAAAEDPASSAEIDRQLHEFSDSIMSPYCPGMTLSGCPSPDARSLREEVRSRLAQGESQQSIRDTLVQRFGSELTGLPDTTRTAGAAYGIPTLMIAAGLFGMFLFIGMGRRNGAGKGTQPADGVYDSLDAAPDEIQSEIFREIDAEVSRRRKSGA